MIKMHHVHNTNEQGLETFSDKQILGEFIADRPSVHKVHGALSGERHR